QLQITPFRMGGLYNVAIADTFRRQLGNLISGICSGIYDPVRALNPCCFMAGMPKLILIGIIPPEKTNMTVRLVPMGIASCIPDRYIWLINDNIPFFQDPA